MMSSKDLQGASVMCTHSNTDAGELCADSKLDVSFPHYPVDTASMISQRNVMFWSSRPQDGFSICFVQS